MVRIIEGIVLAAAMTALWGCGATVGDPCTTASDCGDKLCLNETFTPGGYCTQQCEAVDPESCPSGTVCVRSAVSDALSGCFRRCDGDDDCRAGYSCQSGAEWP